MGLTEVVCHQGRCGDRGLRELLSPAALLLQILQRGEVSNKMCIHPKQHLFLSFEGPFVSSFLPLF